MLQNRRKSWTLPIGVDPVGRGRRLGGSDRHLRGYLIVDTVHEDDEVVELIVIEFCVPGPSSAWIPSSVSGTLVSGG